MKTVLVYTPEEAARNYYVVKKFESSLGAKLVSPDYRGNADVVINRSNDCKIADYFEKQGAVVFNGAKFCRLANDKQLCYDFMQESGIEIMPTHYAIPPFVKKPKNSHGGNGVVMCLNADEYDENQVCQKPATDLGKDVRVWVLGGEIVTSVLRTSKTDFRSNYCLGGSAEVYDLSAEERAEVQKIIDLVSPLGAHYYGVDFVFNHGKAVFNELEDTVGARMVYDLTDIDIIEMYIEYIRKYIN